MSQTHTMERTNFCSVAFSRSYSFGVMCAHTQTNKSKLKSATQGGILLYSQMTNSYLWNNFAITWGEIGGLNRPKITRETESIICKAKRMVALVDST